MSATERVLRETLGDPRRAVEPGVGLLDRARYDGERLRRRRRRRAVTLSVASMLTIVGVGAALSPRLVPRPLLIHPAAGPAALRVSPAPAAGAPDDQRSTAESKAHPTLWTERIGGRLVTVVASYDGRRLCAQPDRPDDADLRPSSCVPVRRHGRGAALLAGPVGGAGGVRAADAAVTRLVLLTSARVDSVIARPVDGDSYVGYLQAMTGPAGGRLFEVVLPAGQRVAGLRFVDGFGATIGTWSPGRS